MLDVQKQERAQHLGRRVSYCAICLPEVWYLRSVEFPPVSKQVQVPMENTNYLRIPMILLYNFHSCFSFGRNFS
jgi:hypothetical protein